MPSSEFNGCAIKWRRQRRATGARWSVTSFTSASTVKICPRCKTGAGPHKPYDKRWTTLISTCPELRVIVAQVRTLPGRVFYPKVVSVGRGRVGDRQGKFWAKDANDK